MEGWQAKLNHFDVPHMKSLIFLTEIYNFESCFWLPALWPESIKCRWVPDMQLGEGVWPDTKRWKMQLFTETFLQPESRSWEEFQPKSGSWEEEKERTCPIVHSNFLLSRCLVTLRDLHSRKKSKLMLRLACLKPLWKRWPPRSLLHLFYAPRETPTATHFQLFPLSSWPPDSIAT